MPGQTAQHSLSTRESTISRTHLREWCACRGSLTFGCRRATIASGNPPGCHVAAIVITRSGEPMKLKRYQNNPILKPDDFQKWDIGAVFNCGVTVTEDSEIVMLFRAVPSGYRKNPSGNGYLNYVSSIGSAVSRDGYSFSTDETAVISPQEEWDRYGCEDPRITRFADDGGTTYLITYTALSDPAFSGTGDRVALATTNDFGIYTRHGVIIPGVNDKDAVFFPERINGKIALLHRIPPDIQIVYFDDLDEITKADEEFWSHYSRSIVNHTILERKYAWESEKIGAGPPPVKTREGWLLLYHGVDGDHVYRTGVALLDLDDPSRVIARSSLPILEPEEDYEITGDVNNVVFPTGAIVLGETLFVYYGAADKVCALATAGVDEILDFLQGFR